MDPISPGGTLPDTGRVTEREAAAQFAAELTRVAFAPLAKALGFFGDVAIAATAHTMARRDFGGLTDGIAELLGRVR